LQTKPELSEVVGLIGLLGVKFHNVVDAFLFALSNLRELGVTK
jgi:hypothetical protein